METSYTPVNSSTEAGDLGSWSQHTRAMILDDLPEQLWGQEGRSQPQLWFGENRHGSGSSKAGTGWSICFEDEESTRQGNCLMHIKGHRQRPSPEHKARLERRGGSQRCSRPQEFWGQRESEPVGPAPAV